MLMLLAHYVFWMLFEHVVLKKKYDSIKPQHRNSMEKFKKFPKVKQHHSILDLPMVCSFLIRTSYYFCSLTAAAKLYAYWITINYREAYNMFAVNGILFNHESPRRGTNKSKTILN